VSSSTIPEGLKKIVAFYTPAEVSFFLGSPLHSIDLRNYVEQKNLSGRGEAPVSSQSPLRVMQHPSSNSHIARSAVTRLEQDVSDFSVDENKGVLPVLKAINTGGGVLNGPGIDRALSSLKGMISALELLRKKDTSIVREGMGELLAYCNSATVGRDGNVQAIGYNLQQKAGAEVPMEFAFIAATTAAADAAGDLCLYNPMLSPLDADGLNCVVMLLMMTANRITHATLALQQARGLLKVLLQMHKAVNNPDQNSTKQANTVQRLHKELLTQSDNLAATLAMRRNYTVPIAPGVFEIDPRFLLFEFCHGLLLRPSQVQPVDFSISYHCNSTFLVHMENKL
jgi:hypothetical protein